MASNAKNIAELLNTDTTVKVGDLEDGSVTTAKPVSYTHLTLPTIYSV